jgi:hypothetical protein
MTEIRAGYGDGNHLAIELRKSRRREHQIVGHGDEGPQFCEIERIGLEHVGNKAQFLHAFVEISLHVGIERGRRQIERRYGGRARLLRRATFPGHRCLRHFSPPCNNRNLS